jgi:hypothetical protein
VADHNRDSQTDKQLQSRFEQALQHYADVINGRDAALLTEKTAREQFETSFRAAVENVILPAAAQVKDLVASERWICLATKPRQWPFGESRDLPRQHEGSDRRATAIKILAALKANKVAHAR